MIFKKYTLDHAIPCSKQMLATVSLCNRPLVLYGVTLPMSPVMDVFLCLLLWMSSCVSCYGCLPVSPVMDVFLCLPSWMSSCVSCYGCLPVSPVMDVFTTHQVLRPAVAALNTPSCLGLHTALLPLWDTLPCAWQANSSSLSRFLLLWRNIL